MTTTSRRGGAREGAGRKAMLPPTSTYTVYLTDNQAAHARALGNGNLAAGVRALIDRDATPPSDHPPRPAPVSTPSPPAAG